jgi:hypothetical protein
MHTDTRKNRAVSISTRLSFLAVNKSGAKAAWSRASPHSRRWLPSSHIALQEPVNRIGAPEARQAEEGRERLGVAERGRDRIDAVVDLALDPLHRQALEGMRMALAVSTDGVASREM